MQKKLTPKQARWQEFLSGFDFQWVHKAGKHNEVADALIRKYVHDYVAALTVIDFDFCGRIRDASLLDQVYQKLLGQVQNGEIRKYWIDDGLLFAKGRRAYVLSGPLLKELLRVGVGKIPKISVYRAYRTELYRKYQKIRYTEIFGTV
ncbi:hypothetical protein F511_26240 [Dorcoceras hygrometricum]|uniref:Reverse transcriptase RNase H-like domain-containing protein n=1 Tax=Dorcoceras hygrometricum TaxID=472368 RepID=A0A2Z7AQ00_9LAMI|nr:hypothetical protein F511_26240 [Dorcoceras hygrometricum]